MPEAIIAAFRGAVERGDPDGVVATLAEDVTFHNPVMFQPFAGLAVVRLVVPKLLAVWQGLRYVAELRGEDTVGLVFDARVGHRSVRGIDLLEFAESGLINRITVLVRPLTGLQALAAEMETALAGASLP